MHTYIKALYKVAGKYAPSRNISIDIVHIFKTLQLVDERGHVSRGLISKEQTLGGGVVKDFDNTSEDARHDTHNKIRNKNDRER
jgi:hypothetical protein